MPIMKFEKTYQFPVLDARKCKNKFTVLFTFQCQACKTTADLIL